MISILNNLKDKKFYDSLKKISKKVFPDYTTTSYKVS